MPARDNRDPAQLETSSWQDRRTSWRSLVVSAMSLKTLRRRPGAFAYLVWLPILFFANAIAQQPLPDAPSATLAKQGQMSANKGRTSRPSDTGWPRIFATHHAHFTIYQPQVDKWEGNVIDLYSAVEVKKDKNSTANYGVVCLKARTEVDKVNRLVTLDQATVTRVTFPAAPDQESKLTSLLQEKLPGVIKTVSLDRLEAEVDLDNEAVNPVAVKNEPPKIMIATKPSLLVLIDGTLELRDVPDTKVQRVINTRSTLLYHNTLYYLHVEGSWLQAPKLEGPWSPAQPLPEEIKKVEKSVSENSGQPAESNPSQQKPAPTKTGTGANVPVVYVLFEPAELIEIEGNPQYKTIPSTNLEYIHNTSGNIFRLKEETYVLISGRWFKSGSLDGPWAFVGRNELPSDLAKIPPDSAKATVLASVPGTPQSKEGIIANSIPQTATITRSEAKLTVKYDGDPMFVPLEGTSLEYAKNTSAAVIRVSENSYYCVEAGVWFNAASPQGPWHVADSIPPQIFDIPPSSALHYVTYVKVYSATPDVVYVGYTPGYYGTVVSADTMTVVYGTGWYYPPYISHTVWYGWPYTYGVGAGFTYSTDSGWSFGFGFGYTYYPWYYPWWGPMGYYGCCWYPHYGWGAWGGAAAANLYGVWGNTAYSHTGAAWANPYTGNYGAATRGAYHNAATGRGTIAGRGYNANAYTGNVGAYRGGVTYNPNTGIVAGAGAGFVGNMYGGQAIAGRGAFAYNPNTNTGMAAGTNNVFAGKDGTVYRYNRNSGNWSSNSGNGWETVNRPQPKLQDQYKMRNEGMQRSYNFNSSHGFSGARMRAGGGRRR